MSRQRSEAEYAARLCELRDRLVPDQAGKAFIGLHEALIVLADLVTDFLEADRLYQQPPCLHRYRGIVREQEIARRRKRRQRARAELASAVRRPGDPDVR